MTRRMRWAATLAVIATVIFAVPGAVPAGGAVGATLSGDLTPVHDPTMVHAPDAWYVFSTGVGLPILRSADRTTWTKVGEVFPNGLPSWVFTEVPSLDPATVDAWAPDVSFHDGRWELYWAIAGFGSRRAVIGLMTNATLDPNDPAYHWVDQGPVITSTSASATAAIDPNAVTDEHGDRWLVWGSFWDGIFIQRLDDTTGKLLAGSSPVNLARRDPWFLGVEGSYVFQRDGWWYLFVSFGFCCKGVSSTYSIHGGRSRQLTGPYLDEQGQPMLVNGGTTMTGSYANVVGPGHGSVVHDGDEWLLVHHFYDRDAAGAPTLSIRPLVWGPDDWPIATDPGFAATTDAAAARRMATGVWHVTGYPEEWPPRGPVDLDVTLRADGTATSPATAFGTAPAGTWRMDGPVVRVEGVTINGQLRSWWWIVDPSASAAIGRDDRSAVVRGARTGDAPVPTTVTTAPATAAVPNPVAATPAFTG